MHQPSLAAGELAPDQSLNLPQASSQTRSRLAGIFGALVSFTLLIVIALYFRDVRLELIERMVPSSGLFWVTFAAYYLAGPFSELGIFRKLWQIPFSGLGALLRKQVSNELLLGYLGEVQFYAWARSHLNFVTAPFGAIKDVTILSALVGNIATLAMLGFAWPLVTSGQIGVEMRSAFLSLGVVLLTSLVILMFRHKLFTLPREELWFISAVHAVRVFVLLGLAAVMWHQVLPQVSIGLWLVMATLRMLVSRLPLVPNKDVVFAGLAIFLMGHDIEIGELMTMMAAIVMAAHILVGGAFGIADVIESWRTR